MSETKEYVIEIRQLRQTDFCRGGVIGRRDSERLICFGICTDRA